MATTIIAQFADGRLIVHESRLCESRYVGSGVPVRIGQVRGIEKVLSVDNSYAMHGLVTHLSEVRVGQMLSGRGAISGTLNEKSDHIMVVMRRGDLPLGSLVSAVPVGISGAAAFLMASGLTSGLAWMGEMVSGHIAISGVVTITATVVGY